MSELNQLELNNNGEKHLDEEQSEQLDDIPVIELLIKVNSLFTFCCLFN